MNPAGSEETRRRLAARAGRTLIYSTAFLGLWGWLALQTRELDPELGGPLPDEVRSVGAILLGAGSVLAITCAALFVWRGRGTPAPFDPPPEFVAAGPYRFVRNPMYLGGLGMLTGFALWHTSPAMLLFAGGVWLLVHLFVVYREEPGLERRFGDSYRRYRDRMNRWVPRWPV